MGARCIYNLLNPQRFFYDVNYLVVLKADMYDEGVRKDVVSTIDISPNPLVRGILFTAGTFFLVIGMIGIVVRLLPTTPFLLLSAACYSKSSKRYHRWLLNNRIFGDYISNYMAGRGISLKFKTVALFALWASILYSAFYVVDMLIIRVLLLIIAVGVSAHLLTIPTFSPSDKD